MLLEYSASKSLSTSQDRDSHDHSSAHFGRFFEFLDAAHQLGYTAMSGQQEERGANKNRREISLQAPSQERCEQNVATLHQKIDYYETMRGIERLRRRYGIHVLLADDLS